MSVWTIGHSEEYPIPKPVGKAKANYCIVSLPQNLIVQRGECSRSIMADLDPGHYRLVVSQMIIPGGHGSGSNRATLMKWRKDFYHEVTPEQHQRIQDAPLRFTKGMMTTDGTRFNCNLPGCSNEATSRVAAVLHEAEHSGVDLLKQPMHPGDVPVPKVNVAVVEQQEAAKKQTAINNLRKAALEG
jgi:hypothetical protein